MSQIANLRPMLPYLGRQDLEVDDHDTNDIIKTIKKYHPVHGKEYDTISDQFWRGNVKDTAKCLFDYLKKHVIYDVEPQDYQTVKSPGAILTQGHGDCKHYASFITGVCDSLARKGKPIKSKYRFVSDSSDKDVHHVFAVVSGQGQDYWVDPVLRTFDKRPTFYNTKDMKGIGAVYHISGTSVGELERTLDTPVKIRTFLANKGAQVNDFANAQHMCQFMQHHLQNPNSTLSPDHFVGNIFQDIKKGVKNTVKKVENKVQAVAHGQKVNAQNLQKGAQQSARKVQTVVKKVAHGQAVNFQNVKKGVQQQVKKQQHALAVNLTNAKQAALKVSFTAARNSFLGLVDINAFNMAHHMWETMHGAQRAAMLKKWSDIGGNPSVLIKAINNGYRGYKKRHGGYDAARDTVSGIGVAVVDDAAIASMVALASAIIAIMKVFMPKLNMQDNREMAAYADQGTKNIIADAAGMNATSDTYAAADALNDITQPGTGTGDMTISTGTEADGTPLVTVHDADYTGSAVDQGSDYTGDDSDNSIESYLTRFKNHVMDHKLEYAAGTAAVFLLTNKKVKKKLGF